MSRGKKPKEEGKMKMYSFGIDTTDPKYKNLIDMLDNIDSGARSFIIRQILNQYANSQAPSPMFGLVIGPNGVDTGMDRGMYYPPNPAMPHPEGAPVAPSPEPEVIEPPKPKKKKPAGLNNLKNTFN